ncbi:MAG: transglycosylase SLT domain-containing protein [Gammaproteobacteria bacterium]|nr:transglycosylase SLT domain-containing protein [Gammaproteobacteria bacterium]
MPRFFRVAFVLALCLLSACNHSGSRSSTNAFANRPNDISAASAVFIQAVYDDGDAARTQGEQALEKLRAGDSAAAADGLAEARSRLAAAAERCAAMHGCAVERIAKAQDALLEAQTQALVGLGATGASDTSTSDDGQPSPVLAALPESERSINLLNGQDLRELIKVNEPLRAALREWLTWMRPQLLDTYENYQYLRYKMWPTYAKNGLPEAVLFGIMAKESGGKVHAVSPSGASGLLQFMPATGKRYGLGADNGFDQRFDPTASTEANAAYLNDQLKRLNNDLELVLGAYNGGESRMVQLSQGGARRFWDPRVFQALAPETREYVPMVLAAAWLFLHPEDYGLRWPKVDQRPGEINLATAMSLNEVSICLGQDGNERGWFRTMRNLNPRWQADTRLPAGTRLEAPARAAEAFKRRCTAPEMVARLQALQDARIPGVAPRVGVRTVAASSAAPAARGATGSAAASATASSKQTHKVAKGETLITIARKHGCNSLKDFASMNGLSAPRYSLREGQTLRVPTCGA